MELFLRTVNEPNLLKLFLKFVLYAKFDERITLLDTLLARINSCDKVSLNLSSEICELNVYTTKILVYLKLSLATLMLFYTMIELNSEDVMYRLIFSYLAPFKHLIKQPNAQVSSSNSLSPPSFKPLGSGVTHDLGVVNVQTLLALSTHLNNSEPNVVNINSEKYNYIQPTSSMYLNEQFPINQWLNSM